MRVDHALVRRLVNENRRNDMPEWEWPDDERIKFAVFDDTPDGNWQPGYATAGGKGLRVRLVKFGPTFADRESCEKFCRMLMGFEADGQRVVARNVLALDLRHKCGYDVVENIGARIAALPPKDDGSPDGILSVDLDPQPFPDEVTA